MEMKRHMIQIKAEKEFQRQNPKEYVHLQDRKKKKNPEEFKKGS